MIICRFDSLRPLDSFNGGEVNICDNWAVSTTLYSLSFLVIQVTEPGRDATTQYILHCTPVKMNTICQHTIFPQPSQEVEVLMNFLCDGINVLDPWQIFRNMHARKHETVDSSHR